MTRWAKAKTLNNASQPSLFDRAERAASEGMNAAYAHANTDWKVACREVLRQLCLDKPEFTTDELWDILGTKGIHTGEPRSLGALIQGASRSGMISHTGQYVKSYRRHNSPIPLWKSNVYRPVK